MGGCHAGQGIFSSAKVQIQAMAMLVCLQTVFIYIYFCIYACNCTQHAASNTMCRTVGCRLMCTHLCGAVLLVVSNAGHKHGLQHQPHAPPQLKATNQEHDEHAQACTGRVTCPLGAAAIQGKSSTCLDTLEAFCADTEAFY